jgi:Trk-type K+ transport system membrane component
MGLTYAIFSIAVILSLLGAAMAFVITYEEYAHHYREKKRVLKKALEAAFFTLFFFLALGLLLAIMLPSWF